MYDVVIIGDSIPVSGLNSLNIRADSLYSCRGEIGAFSLTYRDFETETMKTVDTGTVIINADFERGKPLSDVKYFDDNLKGRLKEFKSGDYVLFVQDYFSISPAYASKRGLKKVINVAGQLPAKEIYYFYRAMRFIDDNDTLYEEARKMGIVFLKYEKGNLQITENQKLVYTRGEINLKVRDNIVIAPEYKAPSTLKRITRIFNLEMGADGFLQPDNIYLQPTLTGKRGVYVLGGARGSTAYSDLKLEVEYTLNEIKSLLSGPEPEPITDKEREIDDQKCVLCYTCYRICPHGAIDRDQELDAMQINNLACQGCNACISHCPAKAISIIGDEVKERETRLKVLICENSALIARDMLKQDNYSDLSIETIPCASSIEKKDIYHFLGHPDHHLLILGCFEESCKHISGDKRGQRIVEEVRESLEKLELGKERVSYKRLSPRMEEDLDSLLSRWKEAVMS